MVGQHIYTFICTYNLFTYLFTFVCLAYFGVLLQLYKETIMVL